MTPCSMSYYVQIASTNAKKPERTESRERDRPRLGVGDVHAVPRCGLRGVSVCRVRALRPLVRTPDETARGGPWPARAGCGSARRTANGPRAVVERATGSVECRLTSGPLDVGRSTGLYIVIGMRASSVERDPAAAPRNRKSKNDCRSKFEVSNQPATDEHTVYRLHEYGTP